MFKYEDEIEMFNETVLLPNAEAEEQSIFYTGLNSDNQSPSCSGDVIYAFFVFFISLAGLCTSVS